jgi:hypothetical protein
MVLIFRTGVFSVVHDLNLEILFRLIDTFESALINYLRTAIPCRVIMRISGFQKHFFTFKLANFFVAWTLFLRLTYFSIFASILSRKLNVQFVLECRDSSVDSGFAGKLYFLLMIFVSFYAYDVQRAVCLWVPPNLYPIGT